MRVLELLGIACFALHFLEFHLARARPLVFVLTAMATVLGFVLFGSLVLLPIWMQTLLGYSSLDAGLAMAPRGIGAFIGMPMVGLFVGRFDPRKFLATGLFIAALTLWAFSTLDLNAGYWNFFWPQFIQGFSLSLLFVPLTTVSMAAIARERMGNATSLFNLLRNIGGSVGIAGVTTLTERFQQTHLGTLVSHVTPYNNQATQMMQSMAQRMTPRQSYAAMFGLASRHAAILSYVNTFRVLAVVFLALIPMILIMRKPGEQRAPAGPR